MIKTMLVLVKSATLAFDILRGKNVGMHCEGLKGEFG